MDRSAAIRQIAAVDHREEAGPAAVMRIAHIITRMILGGAQENTLLSALDQQQLWHDQVTLITGPAIGPEGSLLERASEQKLDVRIVPALRREIHPWRDWQSYRQIVSRSEEHTSEL